MRPTIHMHKAPTKEQATARIFISRNLNPIFTNRYNPSDVSIRDEDDRDGESPGSLLVMFALFLEAAVVF
ncbi:MAG: hypothetical protein O3C43_18055 [Verrucomicrobia bacterium]|nr:hypothetical protein [Verrucomicrobiota bacterium]